MDNMSHKRHKKRVASARSRSKASSLLSDLNQVICPLNVVEQFETFLAQVHLPAQDNDLS